MSATHATRAPIVSPLNDAEQCRAILTLQRAINTRTGCLLAMAELLDIIADLRADGIMLAERIEVDRTPEPAVTYQRRLRLTPASLRAKPLIGGEFPAGSLGGA